MKLGLALGSGGVRGFAHLGVFEVLEREKIPIDMIVGSSAGALFGAMYAFRPKLAPNLTQVRHYLSSELFDSAKLNYLRQDEETRKNLYDKMRIRLAQGAVFASSMTKPALLSKEVLRNNIESLIAPVNIEEALIPFAAVTVDLHNADEVVLDQGQLIPAVMASCAIPGVFPPVEYAERSLMDGGMVNPVPCNHVRNMGADLVIGVDLTPQPGALRPMQNSYEAAMRAADISRFHLKSILLKQADIVIPVATSDIFWGDFSQFDRCVDAGREAAEKALPQIRRALESAKN